MQLVVDVQPFVCSTLNYELQYRANGSSNFVSAQSASILEGETITIKLTPESVRFSITGPNQNSKPLDIEEFIITDAVIGDQGVYVFTTGNGCSFNFNLTITPNETLSNPTLDKIIVYPNPVTYGTLFLTLNEFMNKALTANMFDVYGKLVVSKEFAINHSQEESLNITTLSGGLYILEISLIDSNETILKKVIKLD